MSLERPIQKAREATGDVSQRAKGLVPWLPDPKECPDCGRYCEATRVHDKRVAAFHPNGMVPAWRCPECESAFRRGESDGLSFSPWK